MYALNRTAERLWGRDGDGSIARILGWRFGFCDCGLDTGVNVLTTDCVVEDEDLRSPGPILYQYLSKKPK